MFKKIKQLLEFLRLALRGGWQGLVGVLLIPLVLYLLFTSIFAEGGLVMLVQQSRAEGQMTAMVQTKNARLEDLNMRIALIKNRSGDYIEELIQKHLNMADPKVRILK